MKAAVETLGVAEVDIRYARLRPGREGWVYMRVPVSTQGKCHSIEVVDNRPMTIKAADKVDAASIEINAAKRKRLPRAIQDEIRKKKLYPALEEFRNALNTPAIVSVQEMVTTGGQSAYQRVILNDPKDNEPEATLAFIRTRGLWHRDPYQSPFMPVFGDKSRTTCLLPVFANKEGVRIWELGRDRVRVFEVSFPDGFSVETYEKSVKKKEEPEDKEETIEVAEVGIGVEVPEDPEGPETMHPNPPPVSEPKEESPAAATKPRRKSAQNGKVAVVCDNDECKAKHRIALKKAGQTSCGKCDTGTLVLTKT